MPANGSLLGGRGMLGGVPPRPAKGSLVGGRASGSASGGTVREGDRGNGARAGSAPGVSSARAPADETPRPAKGSLVVVGQGVDARGDGADAPSPKGSSARGLAATVCCPAKGSPPMVAGGAIGMEPVIAGDRKMPERGAAPGGSEAALGG